LKTKEVLNKKGKNVEYIVDVLQCANTPTRFVDLWECTKIQHKATFLDYLKWLTLKGMLMKSFVIGKPRGSGRWSEEGKARQLTVYYTTQRGQDFLELIK
jgi:hypothetical protein